MRFGGNKFGKGKVYNLQARSRFNKKLRNQTDGIIDQFYVTKGTPNVSFNFESCQEIRK